MNTFIIQSVWKDTLSQSTSGQILVCIQYFFNFVWTKSKDMIRLLQISDIHFQIKSSDDDSYAQMRLILPRDIKEQVKKKDVNCILVCGDIAFKADAVEYNEATNFLNELKKASHCDCVRTVPGNHDLNRDKYDSLKEAVRCYVMQDDKDSILSNARSKEPLLIKGLFLQFEEYLRWANNYGSKISPVEIKLLIDLIAEKEGQTKDPFVLESSDRFYWEDLLGEEDGYKFMLYGVNTALLSSKRDSDKERCKQQYFPRQMRTVTRDYENQINILMGHHPLEYIYKGDSIKKDLSPIFNVQLYGHVHRQKPESGQSLIIQSGALMPEEAPQESQCYFPVYNIIEMSIKGSYLHVEVNSRKWANGAFETYPEGSGKFEVPINPKDNKSRKHHKPVTVDVNEKYLSEIIRPTTISRVASKRRTLKPRFEITDKSKIKNPEKNSQIYQFGNNAHVSHLSQREDLNNNINNTSKTSAEQYYSYIRDVCSKLSRTPDYSLRRTSATQFSRKESISLNQEQINQIYARIVDSKAKIQIMKNIYPSDFRFNLIDDSHKMEKVMLLNRYFLTRISRDKMYSELLKQILKMKPVIK